MDNTDKKILQLLQQNAKLTTQEIAEQVALSTTPCFRRIKQLEENGTIKNYVALLDQEVLKLSLTVIVNIGLDNHSPERISNFQIQIKNIPEVIQCYMITGQKADYVLKLVVKDMSHYQSLLLNQITQIDGVSMVHSSFVMHKIVDKTCMPLDFL